MIRSNRRLHANIKNLRTTHLDDVFRDEIEAKQDKVLIGLVNLGAYLQEEIKKKTTDSEKP